MLDTVSLRVAFSAVALSMLVLFYLVTYRTTRSSYSGWWCVALALFLGGSACFLLNGTSQQWWANPLGNVLSLAGSAGVWAGACSLRSARPGWGRLAVVPVAVGTVSLFDDPGSNVWSGGFVFLPGMALLIGLAARELWQLVPAGEDAGSNRTYVRIVQSLAAVSSLVALFYFARWIAFLSVGQHSPFFHVYFGSEVTTIITTMLLAVVSFSMSSLSNEQQTSELRTRATRDDLTGLLNRGEFLHLAGQEVRRTRTSGLPAALILADLDHFKEVNDRHGHAAGDQALQTFAAACRAAVRATDLVGRYGGEEFALLLPATPPHRAEQVAAAISAYLREAQVPGGPCLPTASYGIAPADHRLGLEAAFSLADAALYQAKRNGRDQSVLAESAADHGQLRGAAG
jgi:diguanylate cyclase (GGDEF)-like protein